MKAEQKVLYRMLDANYNRGKEALRVVEDILRFSEAKPTLVRALKKARHELTQIFLALPYGFKKLIECRDVKNDVTKAASIRDRSGKIKIEDLLFSNLQRAQEALRVIEECLKLIQPANASVVARLRFNIYDLEQRIAAEF